MAAAVLKTRILAGLADLLQPLGFRRRGQIFDRPSSDVVHLIGFQSSQTGTAQLARVTLNLGIWVPALSDREARSSVWDAHWHERLGHLTDHQADQWWEVSNDASAAATTHEICSQLLLFGIPALEKIPDSTALLAVWDAGMSPGLTKLQRERYKVALRGTV
jgi:hypothetical protein